MDKISPQDFFAPVANTRPYIKFGFEGFAGTGKTYTAATVAIGLHKKIKSTKPVVMFDTEKSSKFLQKKFEDEGIQLVVKESSTLADLVTTIKLVAEGYAEILIIDSITHVWEKFLEEYKEKNKKVTLYMPDWNIIKPAWKKQFSHLFVHSRVHILMCGRAGYEYDNEINLETGKREIFKSGVKMKVEGETAFEPDLLILMNRYEDLLGSEKKVYREAMILKDRSHLIDSKTFINPKYEDFELAINYALGSPVESSRETQSSSFHLIPDDKDKYMDSKQREIIIEEIKAILDMTYPGSSVDARNSKSKLLSSAFNTTSPTAITTMTLAELTIGFNKIKEKLKPI